jgi:hypothetical protein
MRPKIKKYCTTCLSPFSGDQAMPAYSPMVTFSTDFFKPLPGEAEQSVNEIYGLALSNWLVEKLGKRNIGAEVICAEDWGWLVDVFSIRGEFFLFRLFLGCANTENVFSDSGFVEWGVFITAEIPILDRLFKRVDATPTILELERHLRELVTTIPNVSKIEWGTNHS